MKYQTRGLDYFETISKIKKKNGIKLKKLILIYTHRCSLMVGNNSSLFTRIKNKVEKTKLINFRCIIHQKTVLCTFPNTFNIAMKKLIKIVNFF